MSLRLQEALEALYGLERRRDRHDLAGITALLHALGHPHRRFRSIHVAGTNGKGSVCALIERVLRESGVRTGLFTSPHLVDFRERIRVCGRWADSAWLQGALDRIASLPEGKGRTFFEVCTALAFDHFAGHGVELAVVEVGLGGRFDCTNVLEPELAVITSIGLDHTEILGDTLERIAAEKAGIVKPAVPVVVGALDPAACAVVERIAAERGAAVRRPAPAEPGGGNVPSEPGARSGSHGLEVPTGASGPAGGPGPAPVGPRATFIQAPWGGIEVELGMAGGHQRENAAVALAALGALAEAGHRIPREAVEAGLRAAQWPGRLECCRARPRLWWDGAHNVQGIEALARAWNATGLPPPGAVVLALSRDKDVAGMVARLASLAPGATLVATASRSERSLAAEHIAAAAAAAGLRAQVAPDVATGCGMALDASPGDAPVLLTGSLFAVGEAMEAFGGAPGEML